MNDHAKTMQSDQPANDITTDKSKVEQPKVEQPIVTESKSPLQQTANRMPARADNLFTMGKRHV